ncbi:MAG TPA: hypothetical protein VFV71_06355 [Burkholderiales bacterium]|nr:hypothetical protein [Burkholderiales bacterium]
MHTLTLFISALFPAVARERRAGGSGGAPHMPSLQTLLARGDAAAPTQCEDEAAWLCGYFGLERQDDWPAAPAAALGAGLAPGDAYWLFADPVHMKVHRDRLVLVAPQALAIERTEAAALCAALSAHFASDGVEFLAADAQRWYLRRRAPARIRTCGLSRAAGRDVDALLPEGEDRLAWHRLINEAQMLMHAHEVNQAREARGDPAINSLWLSGGGKAAAVKAPCDAVAADGALARGLARLAGLPCVPARDGSGALQTPSLAHAGSVLVELDAALPAWLTSDDAGWQSALEDLERRWFAPLLRALSRGEIERLDIAAVADGRAHRWSVRRPHLWRFWRAAKPLPGSAVSA